MGFRFEANETVPDGLKRIPLEQSRKAIDKLKVHHVNRDEAIHDARVRFKKIRAVLRLARGGIDEDIYQKENARYRDAGRRLSTVRDTAAMIEIIDKLSERFASQLAA